MIWSFSCLVLTSHVDDGVDLGVCAAEPLGDLGLDEGLLVDPGVVGVDEDVGVGLIVGAEVHGADPPLVGLENKAF